MVSAAPRLSFAAGLALFLAVPLPAKELSDYRIGDTIEADISTPVPLRVVDPDGTELLKQKEAFRVPSIFRFDPATADVVENDFRDTFTNARSNFLQLVQERFPKRRLDETALATPKFQRTVATFQRQNKTFPLTTNLAELWARGDAGRVIQSSVIARLRAVMERPVRTDTLPAGFKPGNQVRLVTVTNRNEALTLEDAEQRGLPTARSNVLTLTRARMELHSTFPPEERALGKLAAAALRFNCFPDIALTQQARTRRTDPLFVADNYEAGQVVARRGQVVDAKVKAALDQLAEKTAVGHLQRQVGEEQAKTAQVRRRDQWLWAGLAVVTLVLISVSWRLARGRKQVSLLPARVAGDGSDAAIISCPSCEENIVIPASVVDAGNADGWQQRALAAERRAERAQAAIRAGVLAHFADWLKHKFVRGLVSERSQMLDAQKSAATEMAEMERRLDELHTPLQERLRAYEKRIAELERLLAAKGEENRELLRAKIHLTRRQLERERGRTVAELN